MRFLTRILLCCLVTFKATFCEKNEEKRLLVNDPNFILQKLQEMETKMQELTGKVDQQQTTISQQQTTIAQLQSLTGKVDQQQTTIAQLQAQQTTQSGGSTYIRWGRTTCPGNESELVYAGYTGGTHFNRHGGVADYVCLPPDPYLGQATAVNDTFVQQMYGGEYDFGHLKNDDVPCALCRSLKRTTVLMIPGKNACYNGWNMEYNGLLVSDRYVHTSSTQFICLDSNYGAIPGSRISTDGKLFVPVIGKCGSLQCPPYEPDKYFAQSKCDNLSLLNSVLGNGGAHTI